MKKLERQLGLSAVIAMGIGASLGSGIFVLPSVALAHTGPSVWLAYLLAGLCIIPSSLSKAELATAMPSSGGVYVYIERTFGPMAGAIAGLGLYLTLLLKNAFALVGFGAYLSVFTDIPVVVTALSFLALMVVINILGVGKVSKILVLIVGVSVVTLVGLSVQGFWVLEPLHMEPLFPKGTYQFFYTLCLVFVSYAGVTKLVAVSEEIKNPEKNLPRGIIISVVSLAVIYSSVSYVLAGVLPYSHYQNDLKPIYTLARHLSGPYVGVGVAVISVLTMVAQANTGILASSRFPFAMSRDRLMPSFLGQLHKKYLTPIWSIILSGALVSCFILFLNVESLAKWASAFLFLVFAFVNMSVIVLRETRVQWYGPSYHSPFYPWMQVFGVLVSLFAFFIIGFTMLEAVLFISIPGALLYFLFGRYRTERKGVLGFRGARKDLIESRETPKIRKSFIDFSQDAKVVVSLFGKEKSPEMLFEIGVALAQNDKVEVAFLIEVPEQTDLDDIQEDSPIIRSIRRRILTMSEKEQVEMSFDPIVSHDIFKSLHEISQRLHCFWLVIEWVGRTHGAFTLHNPMGWLKGHLSCHLAMVRDNGVRYIRKIMVVLKEAVGDRFLADTASLLAQEYRAEVTFARFVEENSEERRYESYQYLKRVAEYCSKESEILVLSGKEEEDAIIQASEEFDLLVFPTHNYTWKERILGSSEEKIMLNAACSVMAVQSGQAFPNWEQV
ncbi:MAG: universal stress protein [Bdellovibrio sp.]|nr:MAG: universal stress protein [Bdellovibrio sp.]